MFLAIDTLVTYDLKICSSFMANFPAAQWIEYCTKKAVPIMEIPFRGACRFFVLFCFFIYFFRWFVPFPILYCDQAYNYYSENTYFYIDSLCACFLYVLHLWHITLLKFALHSWQVPRSSVGRALYRESGPSQDGDPDTGNLPFFLFDFFFYLFFFICFVFFL